VTTDNQCVGDTDPVPQVVHVGSSQVKVINEFIYLGAYAGPDLADEGPGAQLTWGH